MTAKYVLVDFENVQPDLSLLADSAYKVKVFFGARQQEGRVPFRLLDAMLALGGNVEPVKVKRSGSNAVDMHIAYYLGRLVEQDPGVELHVISGDTDFDPLVEFLRAQGVDCRRTKTITELTRHSHARPAAAKPRVAAAPGRAAKAAATRKSHNDELAPIIKHLHSLSGKPATRRKLAQTIANYFRHHGGARPDAAIEQLIDELIAGKYVSQNGNKVAYQLA